MFDEGCQQDEGSLILWLKLKWVLILWLLIIVLNAMWYFFLHIRFVILYISISVWYVIKDDFYSLMYQTIRNLLAWLYGLGLTISHVVFDLFLVVPYWIFGFGHWLNVISTESSWNQIVWVCLLCFFFFFSQELGF